ncbi:hypothetical protein [Rugosimonospora acidiphila]
MDLHPCVCGEARFERDSSVGEAGGIDRVGEAGGIDGAGGGWLCRYRGECERCGRERLFEFRQPERLVVPPEGAWSVDGTSQLLDAGEWLWLADLLGARPADPPDGGGAALDRDREALASAAAAIDEVLRFLPDGTGTVPDSAFWSERGAGLRAVEPGRFRRASLVAAAAAYRSVLAGSGQESR